MINCLFHLILVTWITLVSGSFFKFPWIDGSSGLSSPVSKNTFTRLNGCPISSKYNIETVGPYGPLLGQDSQFYEEMGHFNRERIPERVVHARGIGAFGQFKPTNPLLAARYTKAKVFTQPGTTPVFVRFSTTIGSAGSADTVRDTRGFATRFYTSEGIYDLLSLSIPVFPVSDPLRFISFIHSLKPDPIGNWPNPSYEFDFLANNPEALHAFTYLYTDLGTPDGYLYLPGWSINTYVLTNSKGDMFYTRFFWKPEPSLRNLTQSEAVKLAGEDPSYASKGLYNAIEAKKYPTWYLKAQIIDFETAKKAKFNILDPTKIWWENEYPFVELGKLILNKNPEDNFAETEQAAFAPSKTVLGIGPSSDKLLQGRLFAYPDTQNYRLGANNYKLPINLPINQIVNPITRDGASVYDDNGSPFPNYQPSSFGNRFVEYPSESISLSLAESCIVGRYDNRNDDSYSQVGQLWNQLASGDKNNLIDNLSSALSKASKSIQDKIVALCSKADPQYGSKLASALQLKTNRKN